MTSVATATKTTTAAQPQSAISDQHTTALTEKTGDGSPTAQSGGAPMDGKSITSISGPDTIARRTKDKDSRNIPFKSDAQTFAALHIAHQNQQCVSKTAAFRVLGLFPSQSKATRHLEKMKSALPGFTIASHTWFPVLKGPAGSEEDARRAQIATVERVQSYLKECKEQNEKIVTQIGDEHAEERYEESHVMWQEKQKLEMDLAMINNDGDEDDGEELDVPRTSEVRGQNWCAVSIVASPNINDEPCINVLRAFETREEAEDYVRNTCLEEEVVTKVFAVRMYEWVSPCMIFTKEFFNNVKTSYSYSELEELHAGKAEERKTIEKILAAQGKTPDDVFTVIGEEEQQEPVAQLKG